jgi:hypothetical protein
MSISSTGQGLNVLIRCEASLAHHDWMAFASWYSLTKNLPDAEVHVLCCGPPQYDFLRWAKKVDVRFISQGRPKSGFYESLPRPVIVINPTVMAVRELVPNLLAHLQKSGDWSSPDGEARLLTENGEPWKPVDWLEAPATVNDWVTFISYAEGCGKFVAGRWINKGECPFDRAARLGKEFMSCNEIRILKLWQQLSSLYPTLSRG